MVGGKKIIWVVLFMTSCFVSSEEEFRLKGQRIVRDITSILSSIENHEELQAAAPQLKKQFKKLANVLIEVRMYRSDHPQYLWKKEPLHESEELFAELARLYEIPGCREIIERSQVDAVYALLKGQ